MTLRWTVAGLAALGLGVAVGAVWMGSVRPRLLGGQATATVSPVSAGAASSAPDTACDPNAKPANLDFTLKDMHGRDVRLSAFKGQVILVNFWATWCPPCKVEIPWFVEFYRRYKDRGFVVLGISVDDPPDKLKEFAAQFKMNYPVLVGLGRDDVQEAFGPLWGIPVSVFISRDGRVCKRHTGLSSKEMFEKEITGLL